MEGRSDLEWMRLHVETCFTLEPDGRLARINEPRGGPAPRFLLGRTSDGNRCWFGPGADETLVEALERHEAVRQVAPVTGPGPLEAELSALASAHGEVERTWSGPTYRFPDTLPQPRACVLVTRANAEVLSPHFEAWHDDVGREPFAAFLEKGRAVAICVSVRSTERADEGGVETHPDHWGRGLGRRVAAHWAASVRAAGRTPLYSTSWTNEASRGLARGLGLIRFGATFHVT